MKRHIHIAGDKLPHWHQAGCVQFVTFRLADSLPQAVLAEYAQAREEWLARHPRPWDDAVLAEYDRSVGSAVDKWLAAGHGSCVLRDGRVRKIVEDAMLYADGDRYALLAYVIMPNHVHVLLALAGGNTVRSVVGSWKRFSAHAINRLLGQGGAVWERDCFDRMVRSGADFDAKVRYIEENPQHLPAGSYTLRVLW